MHLSVLVPPYFGLSSLIFFVGLGRSCGARAPNAASAQCRPRVRRFFGALTLVHAGMPRVPSRAFMRARPPTARRNVLRRARRSESGGLSRVGPKRGCGIAREPSVLQEMSKQSCVFRWRVSGGRTVVAPKQAATRIAARDRLI